MRVFKCSYFSIDFKDSFVIYSSLERHFQNFIYLYIKYKYVYLCVKYKYAYLYITYKYTVYIYNIYIYIISCCFIAHSLESFSCWWNTVIWMSSIDELTLFPYAVFDTVTLPWKEVTKAEHSSILPGICLGTTHYITLRFLLVWCTPWPKWLGEEKLTHSGHSSPLKEVKAGI